MSDTITPSRVTLPEPTYSWTETPEFTVETNDAPEYLGGGWWSGGRHAFRYNLAQAVDSAIRMITPRTVHERVGKVITDEVRPAYFAAADVRVVDHHGTVLWPVAG